MQIIKNILKTNKLIFLIYTKLFSFLLRAIGFFIPTNDKQILFVVYGGQRYDDSPKAVYEAMKADRRFEDFTFKWAFLDPESIDEVSHHEKLKIDTPSYFIQALKSKYWITNSSASRGLNFMKPSTKNIFFTHGMTGIKKIGLDIDNRTGFDLFREIHDYIVLEGKKEEEIIRRAWGVQESTNILNIGLPRNDDLFTRDADSIERLKKHLGLPKDKKVILYAPTFREYNRDSTFATLLSPPFDFDHWYRELGNDYILLLTAHYEVSKLMNVPENHPFVVNAFKYPNINDLIIVSDLLISDYSSIIFDFALTERPIFSYAYDYDQYSVQRGIYEGYEKLFYNGVLKSEAEVIEAIKNIDYEVQSAHIKTVKDSYFSHYGDATERFINVFIEEIYEQD
ncbi:CDP-glycerol glycerophosphotransferase family protein [Streptococcus sp. E29BA]|uniref:CDP-glycerol glycerophosphotransferase family protein n=1 Tax=Streptococcus sp. E29BA TaxID=3278716 RepID=UPI00359EA9D0